MISTQRIPLAHLPTPLWHSAALDSLVGCELWVKRDDMSGGAEAGNKLRKLEYLLFAAKAQGARVVITCGGAQSNHARATALCARRVGLRPLLFLRSSDPQPAVVGNLFLDRLVDAEVRIISAEQYAQRQQLMSDAAAQLSKAGEPAYVIPEGGSNGLGSLGYLHAAAEIREQMDLGQCDSKEPFDWVVCACGSGGTAAGLALGARHHNIAEQVRAIAVCDSSEYFSKVTSAIIAEARALAEVSEVAPLLIDDAFIGPGYGVMSAEQRSFLVEVARVSGLILDPVYSGKALYGLARLPNKPRRVLFVHTGGLPGLLAQASDFTAALSAAGH